MIQKHWVETERTTRKGTPWFEVQWSVQEKRAGRKCHRISQRAI